MRVSQLLTDIFSARYRGRLVFTDVGEAERRLLVQGFQIISSDLFPYYGGDGKVHEVHKTIWSSLNDLLARELGVKTLSPAGYHGTYTYGGQQSSQWTLWPLHMVAENYLNAPLQPGASADRHMKERLSLFELALCKKLQQMEASKRVLDAHTAAAKSATILTTVSKPQPFEREFHRINYPKLRASYEAASEEFNARLLQAGVPLNYHNGFIQFSTDDVIEEMIGKPFWSLLGHEKWVNVDIDMKEALDRRDRVERDAGLYAAKALESTIKIVSTERGWTRGVESGASQYIDNLVAQANGRFIGPWQAEAMKVIFRGVRNDLGHGPGADPMPSLTPPQTDLVIEGCMSWIRYLVRIHEQ